MRYGGPPVVPRRGKTHTTTAVWRTSSSPEKGLNSHNYGGDLLVSRLMVFLSVVKHRLHNEDVNFFWNKIEQLYLDSEISLRTTTEEHLAMKAAKNAGKRKSMESSENNIPENLNEINQDNQDMESDDDVELTDLSPSNDFEKVKTILPWQHAIGKIRIVRSSVHDWFVGKHNISEDFHEFQRQTTEQLKNNPSLSYVTDIVQILCLSSIMFIKEDKPEYLQCSDQRKSMLPKRLIPSPLPAVVQLIIVEYSMLLTDTITRNFFLTLTPNSIDHKIDEDTFVHRAQWRILEL
ncbi:hypothetical protein F8M41_025597 [Gigaspora margarita]|uniref:Uncharacterized protein n=1 Tax=Gigaspora margarita TaxID=4874 RepID=A0A8H3XKY7_GIGMA|nr:hypothetical protein F8M41_025597 [Gigaspora margarita]